MVEQAGGTTLISGTTRLYAVLGDPVRQVRAPELLNPLFGRLGLDAVLVPVHVAPDRLAEVVRGLQAIRNLDGLLVTVPHKAAVLRLADRVGPTAALADCANALRREPDGSWLAENFDGIGFVDALTSAGRDPAGSAVALVGAGGAGSSIAPALLTAGVARLLIADLDPARAHALAERMSVHFPGRAAAAALPAIGGPGNGTNGTEAGDGTRDSWLGSVDLAVNATPLGMRSEDPLPFDPADLRPGAAVADVVMKPAETRLLREAVRLGLPVHPGGPMLDRQTDRYREFFGF